MGTPQRGWGQGKLLDTAEEDYFNADDDDDDEPIPIVSTPPPRGLGKRIRRSTGRTSIPIRSSPKQFNGAPQRMPPLGSLVDYDEGDDAAVENTAPLVPGRDYFVTVGPPTPSPSPSDAPPASPRMSHRQVVGVKSPLSPEEDSDIMEALSKGAPSALLASKPPAGMAIPEGGLRTKRPRDDDDDELLERLANKAKRPTPSPSSPNPDTDPLTGAAKLVPVKGAEEGPKKFKLKIGAVGAAVANSSPSSTSPSSTGTKDGDNG